MTAPAASKTFQGECPKCETLSTHEEFVRESRRAGSAMAAARGEFKAMMEYAFRCQACGARNDKVLDTKGDLHKWQGNRHVTMHVG